MNVLIIEDDPIVAFDIQSIINDLGEFDASIVADMDMALSVARQKHIDIVLADIHIKGENDGIKTSRILQSLYQCSVVFLTSFNDSETLRRAVDIDFSAYLLKPFKEDELVTTLRLCAIKINTKKSSHCIGNGYTYDYTRQQLFHNEVLIILTNKEHQLFLLLLNARGNVVPFETIDTTLWYKKVVGNETRRQLFFRLNQKIGDLNFTTIRNEGYRLST